MKIGTPPAGAFLFRAYFGRSPRQFVIGMVKILSATAVGAWAGYVGLAGIEMLEALFRG